MNLLLELLLELVLELLLVRCFCCYCMYLVCN